MQERGGQEYQGERARLEHEAVDPPVRRRPQPADEEEKEERREEEEDLRRPHFPLPAADEETDAEDREAEEAGEQVRGAADETPTELDLDLLERLPPAHEIGDRVSDVPPREERRSVPGRSEHGAVDADDPVAGEDPRPLGARPQEDLAHAQRPGRVGLEDDAVVRAGHQDVHDRQQRQQEGERAEDREQEAEACPGHRVDSAPARYTDAKGLGCRLGSGAPASRARAKVARSRPEGTRGRAWRVPRPPRVGSFEGDAPMTPDRPEPPTDPKASRPATPPPPPRPTDAERPAPRWRPVGGERPWRGPYPV